MLIGWITEKTETGHVIGENDFTRNKKVHLLKKTYVEVHFNDSMT